MNTRAYIARKTKCKRYLPKLNACLYLDDMPCECLQIKVLKHIVFYKNATKFNILKMLYEKQNGICGICKQPAELIDCNIDHILPVSKGGQNTKDNLRATHIICNTLRGNKIEE